MFKRSITQYYHMVYLKTSLDMIPPIQVPFCQHFMILKTYTQHTSTYVSCQNHIFKNVFLVKQDQKHLPLFISLHIMYLYRYTNLDIEMSALSPLEIAFAPSPPLKLPTLPFLWADHPGFLRFLSLRVPARSMPSRPWIWLENLPQVGVKKHVWNHHLDSIYIIYSNT